MNDVNKVFISALCGSVIGWLFTQLTEWRKGNREDRRIRKEVLFFLLQLYKLMRSYILSVEQNKVTANIQPDEKPLPPFPSDKLALKDMLGLNERFNTALNKFASVDPVLAINLINKTSFAKFVDDLNLIAEIHSQTMLTEDIGQSKSIIEEEVAKALQLVIGPLTIELREIISTLSRKISPAINSDTQKHLAYIDDITNTKKPGNLPPNWRVRYYKIEKSEIPK